MTHPLSQRLRDMHAMAANSCDPEFNKALLDAAKEIDKLMGDVISLRSQVERQNADGHHKLDTDRQVFFYEQDFYVLSNFSAFNLIWKDIGFDTLEHAYHWEKFVGEQNIGVRSKIRRAPSAHEAFKLAEVHKDWRRPDWDSVRVDIMRSLLRAKVRQHEYVHRKLLATGLRELIEDSWRDDFWGWGPNRDGQNMLGKLWMEVRAELRAMAFSSDERP